MRLCEEHRLGGVSACRDDQCIGCVVDDVVRERDDAMAVVVIAREFANGCSCFTPDGKCGGTCAPCRLRKALLRVPKERYTLKGS